MISDPPIPPEFMVPTKHGQFRLLPYTETLVGVDNQAPDDPFVVNRIPVRFSGWIERKDERWQVSSPRDFDASRRPPAGRSPYAMPALPLRTRERVLQLVCDAVSDWASGHAELLTELERRSLANRIDELRRQLATSEESTERLRAELHALKRRAAELTSSTTARHRRGYRRARGQPERAGTPSLPDQGP